MQSMMVDTAARIARTSAIAILAGIAMLHSADRAIGQLPNIVYILADDMGIGDVRSYTPTSPVNTPNLDRLANAGMRFTNAQTPSSVCTPTRYGLLTGQYAWRGASVSNVVGTFGASILGPERLTVAQMLKSSGYDTAMFGKWHLGMTWPTTNGAAPTGNGSNVNFSQPIANGPVDRGFDTFFGIDGSANFPPYAYIRDRQTVGSDLVTPAVPTGQVQGNPVDPKNLPGPIAAGFNTTDTVPTLTNAAVSYIGAKANQPNPFFTYFALTAPHEPVTPASSAVIGDSGYTGPNKVYGDFIWSVDWAVGQVLDALSDPNHDGNTSDSIVDNTLVVFSADNGASKSASFSTSGGYVDGVPLRGDKATIYEAGFRVPFLAQWNGHIPAGTTNNHLVELNDFISTTANIVGYNLPSTAAEDSVNILPELLGTSVGPSRPISVAQSVNGTLAIRQVDTAGNEWKLIFAAGDGNMGDSTKLDPKNAITNFSTVQLYNLTTDPGEQTNLLSGGGTALSQQKTLQLQEYLQDYIYAGRSAVIPPRTGTNGTTTMHVDFGLSNQQSAGSGWNNVSGTQYTDATISKGLYDEGGGYTGIVIKSQFVNGSGVTGVQEGSHNYDGPYPAELAGIPASALKDGFYVADANKLVITLSSLDANATYDFLFYSAAKYEVDYTLFTVTGDTVQQAHIAPVSNNATQVAAINGVVADALKMIRIDVEGRLANGSPQNPSVFFDGRGQINYIQIIEHLLEVPGDYNGDRLVDTSDYTAWRNAFGATGTNLADGNHDGVVDSADYVVWRRAFAANPPGSGSSFGSMPNVPEPSTSILTVIGLIGSCATSVRRPRRRLTGEIT